MTVRGQDLFRPGALEPHVPHEPMEAGAISALLHTGRGWFCSRCGLYGRGPELDDEPCLNDEQLAYAWLASSFYRLVTRRPTGG